MPSPNGSRKRKKEAAAGFEPTNNGFANRRLRPLGYAALMEAKWFAVCTLSAGGSVYLEPTDRSSSTC